MTTKLREISLFGTGNETVKRYGLALVRETVRAREARDDVSDACNDGRVNGARDLSRGSDADVAEPVLTNNLSIPFPRILLTITLPFLATSCLFPNWHSLLTLLSS